MTPTLSIVGGLLIVLCVVMGRQVLSMRRQVAAMHQGNALFRSVMECALDCVIIIDEQRMIVEYNPAAETLFGFKREDVLGKNLTEILVPPRLREAHNAGFDRYLSTRKAKIIGTRVEIVALHADRGEIPIELAISVAPDGKSGLLFVAYIRDISERQRAEQELVKRKEEAERANAVKGEFLANVSHELRTPAHAIRSYAGFGKRRFESAEREKLGGYFNVVADSADSLISLVDELLDLSALEAGVMMLERRTTSLLTVVESVVTEYSAVCEESQIAVAVQNEAEQAFAFADAGRVGQVLRNLLSNAVRFAPAASTIRIELCEVGEMLQISVCDQGPGVPEEELESIFDKFVQSSRTKDGSGGTGLGLSICQQIVARHEGRIWAENDPDGGAILRVHCPVRSGEMQSGRTLAVTASTLDDPTPAAPATEGGADGA